MELLFSKLSHILQFLLVSTRLWVKKEQKFIPVLQMKKEKLRAVPRPHSETRQSWIWNS